MSLISRETGAGTGGSLDDGLRGQIAPAQTDVQPPNERYRPFGINRDAEEIEEYAEAALTKAKLEGQLLAVRARWISLFVVGIMLPIVNPAWPVLYYHFTLVLFALIGYAQLRVARLGQSRTELALIFC
ncbi:MAG: hypothetical protein AAF035_14745, partial [Pseudomonadota bacterium]